VLGVAAVVAEVLLMQRVHELHVAERVAAGGVVRKLAFGAVAAGSTVLLVVLAYWGVFQLGI